MAQAYRSRVLSAHLESRKALGGMFESLINSTSRHVTIRSTSDGTVPLTALYHLQSIAGSNVSKLFLGRTHAGHQPFALQNDIPLPHSPFANILFKATRTVQRVAVEQQADIMRRQLAGHPDLMTRLEFGMVVAAEQEQAFRPNPFAQYDPVHLWVDPKGYQLSERVWRTAGQTRRKIDQLLDETVRQGKPSREIIQELEQFLTPGRRLTRQSVYGTTGSYDAERLLRTEISRAEASAAEIVARLNPFIEAVDIVLSPSHEVPCICEDAAANGPYPKDDIPSQYKIPMHSNCLCRYAYVYKADRNAVIEQLRQDSRGGGLLNPLMVERLLQLLLTGVVAREAEEVFSG